MTLDLCGLELQVCSFKLTRFLLYWFNHRRRILLTIFPTVTPGGRTEAVNEMLRAAKGIGEAFAHMTVNQQQTSQNGQFQENAAFGFSS